MTEVLFYSNAPDKFQTACTLAAKAVGKGMRAMLYTADATASDRLSRMLWSLPATGFVPHCDAGAALAAHLPDWQVTTAGTLVVEGGKIRAVGASVTVPANAERRDVSGKVILPGLVDTHSHIGIGGGGDGCGAGARAPRRYQSRTAS